jgi:hypothetical protein
MTSYDLSRLLTPIDDASPSGDDLEYDPAFVELERIAAPTTERSIGDNVKPARTHERRARGNPPERRVDPAAGFVRMV